MKLIYGFSFAATVMCASLCAADASVSINTTTDSVNQQQSTVITLEKKNDTANNLTESQKEDLEDAAQEAAQVSREAAHQCRMVQKDECISERSMHKRGHALGYSAPSIIMLNMNGIKNLKDMESTLQNKVFPFEENRFFMLGFGGYHESPEGIRVGGMWSAGYRAFQSKKYTTNDTLGIHDSATILRIIPVYGGLTVDKAIYLGPTSISLGGLIGGGVYIVNKKSYDVSGGDIFTHVNVDTSTSDSSNSQESIDFAFAPFLALEAHTSVTIELAPLFQTALEGFVLATYSPEGYGPATGDFWSVSPGIRIRLIFGKAN